MIRPFSALIYFDIAKLINKIFRVCNSHWLQDTDNMNLLEKYKRCSLPIRNDAKYATSAVMLQSVIYMSNFIILSILLTRKQEECRYDLLSVTWCLYFLSAQWEPFASPIWINESTKGNLYSNSARYNTFVWPWCDRVMRNVHETISISKRHRNFGIKKKWVLMMARKLLLRSMCNIVLCWPYRPVMPAISLANANFAIYFQW